MTNTSEDEMEIKNQQHASENKQFNVDAIENYLRNRGILRKIEHTSNLVAIPLIIVSSIGIVFILVWAETILVPFVIALFFTYLIQPMINLLTVPLGNCSEIHCLNHFSSSGCRRQSMTAGIQYRPGYVQRKPTLSDASLDQVEVVFDDRSSTSSNSNIEDIALICRKIDDCTHVGELELPTKIDGGTVEFSNSELRSRANNGFKNLEKTQQEKFNDDGMFQGASSSQKRCFRCEVLRCPRWLAVILCMALVFGFFAGIVVVIVDAVQTFENNDAADFEDKMVDTFLSIRTWVKNTFNIDLKSLQDQFKTEFEWVSITKALFVGAIEACEYFFIVFLFVLYMLFESDEQKSAPESVALSYETSHARDLRKQIDQQIQRYLVIKTLISFIVGLGVYFILGPILGVKMAHVFGIITFFANYVPNVGAMISTILPIPIVLFDSSVDTLSAILAVVLPVSIHLVVGNILEPKVFGDTMELHPVVVLLSLSFWYNVWGIPGAILSVPITAVLRIILSNIEHPYATILLCILKGKSPGSKAFHDAYAK